MCMATMSPSARASRRSPQPASTPPIRPQWTAALAAYRALCDSSEPEARQSAQYLAAARVCAAARDVQDGLRGGAVYLGAAGGRGGALQLPAGGVARCTRPSPHATPRWLGCFASRM